jgi:plastocyanin
MSRPSLLAAASVVALLGGGVVSPAAAGDVRGTVKLVRPSDAERTVVYVVSVPETAFTPTPTTERLSQKGAIFKPGVLPLVRGSQVDMTNDDWVSHNAFSRSDPKSFDLGIYAQDKKKVVVFDQLGVVEVFCSIHPRMNAVVLVLQNPFFAKPGRDGAFVIQGLPAGTYELKVYAPDGAGGTASVKVPASGVVETQL